MNSSGDKMTSKTSTHLTTATTQPLKIMTSIMLGLIVVGCASKPIHQRPHGFYQHGIPERYQVRRGDTVSKIAARYDLNWREISRINRLDANHTIRVGQWLVLTPTSNSRYQPIPAKTNPAPQRPINVIRDVKPIHQSSVTTALPHTISKSNPTPNHHPIPNSTPNSITTVSPDNNSHIYTNIAHVQPFGYPTDRRLNIARHFGTPVYLNGRPTQSEGTWFLGGNNEPIKATQSGEVIQTTQTATGDVIDILHEGGFISSYFHVKDVMVKQGQRVNKGEVIAKMRQQQSGMALLELRIAQHGNYINPMMLLK